MRGLQDRCRQRQQHGSERCHNPIGADVCVLGSRKPRAERSRRPRNGTPSSRPSTSIEHAALLPLRVGRSAMRGPYLAALLLAFVPASESRAALTCNSCISPSSAPLPLQLSNPAAATMDVLRLRGGEYNFATQVFAEYVGTFFLLTAVRFSSKFPPSWLRPVQVPVLTMLAFLIYAIGPISSASFNPAVNIAFVVAGEMSLNKFFFYSLVQLAGAATATKVAACFGA